MQELRTCLTIFFFLTAFQRLTPSLAGVPNIAQYIKEYRSIAPMIHLTAVAKHPQQHLKHEKQQPPWVQGNVSPLSLIQLKADEIPSKAC